MGAMLIAALATPDGVRRRGRASSASRTSSSARSISSLYAIAGRDDPRAVRRRPPVRARRRHRTVAARDRRLRRRAGAARRSGSSRSTIDYLGPLVGGGRGWRVSPAHFVERHGLIIIIALGESIVAIGVGAAGLSLDAATIAAALLGMVVAAALWWSYFDWVIFVAQARMTDATGAERAALARDLYTYLHMPMVFGVVLFALGMKETLGHVDEPLGVIPAIGLCGGLALYMAAHVAVRLRTSGGWGHGRPTATVVLLALIPVATIVPSLVALALVAAVCATLIAYEAIRYRYARSWIRNHRGEFTIEELSRIAPHTGGAPIDPE